MVDAGRQAIATIVYALALLLMLGWLLEIGQSILLPVLIAVIAVYVLTTAAEALTKVPVIGLLSRRWRRLFVLLIFLSVVFFLARFIGASAAAISAAMPVYIENLNSLQERALDALGMDGSPGWASYGDRLMEMIDVTNILPRIISTVTNGGSLIVAAILYTVFILADLDRLPGKIRLAFGDSGQAEKTLEVAGKINRRIGDYLAAKTLVNAILGLVSYVALRLLGIEHAVFWALLIGLLNYIPYIGSVIGVLFPVTMSLVQFASFGHSALTLLALLAPQMAVAYAIEPRFLGQSVNLSPFTVLLSLAVWGALWGLTGAILAVPLTAMVTIILAESSGTRFLAVLMSDTGEV